VDNEHLEHASTAAGTRNDEKSLGDGEQFVLDADATT